MTSSNSSNPGIDSSMSPTASSSNMVATTTTTSSGTTTTTTTLSSPRSSSPPNANRCVSPRDPTIRHAGRTHIRGKIRRVWRPRYLELCDSGLVRYYELPPTADVTLPEDSDWDHVHMIPKDSLVIYNARIIDVTTLRDLHVGLPRGSYGFLFRGQRQLNKELLVHHPEPNPPRDYFCAVSTLEEAQTWVIALQWAALAGQELRPHHYTNNHLSRLECYNPNHQYQQNQHHQQQQNHSSRTMTEEETISSTNTTNDMDTTSTTSIATNSATDTTATTTTSKPPSSSSSSRGRIVVTKIQGYRIVQTKAMQWHVAYEIALLLIQASKIEERRLLRTRQELAHTCHQLSTQLSSDKQKKKMMDLPNQLLKTLPTTFGSHQEIVKSFSTVDRLLRHLVLEATIVNSQALKRCLVLDNSTKLRIEKAPTFYEYYKMNANTILSRHIRSVSEREDYVKRWLKTTKSHKATTTATTSALWILQKPVLLWGCCGAVLVLLVPAWKLYQSIMVSITIRLDVLVGTWLLAAFVGRDYLAPPAATTKSRTRKTAKKVVVSTAPTTSSASSTGTTATSSATPGVVVDAGSDDSAGDEDDDDDDIDEDDEILYEDDENVKDGHRLSSPLPEHPANNGESCWSVPPDVSIFKVRGANYLQDRIKLPSGPSPFKCRGVDMWLTDNPERHIARHPSCLGGNLLTANKDTFLVNFLLPFGNFVSYFEIPPLEEFPEKLAMVWTKFLQGDQQYRDARLKLLPVVMEGPWIVKAAVGNGTAPALLGKVIPLQYFFRDPCQKLNADGSVTTTSPGIYEVDVIITASSIAKGILSVVKGHTKTLTIAFAFIIEAALAEELPETVLCSFQVHSIHLEDCPHLPECNLDEME